MKQIIAIVILGICLGACVAAPAPGSRQCSSNGVCIKIQVAEPIRLDEPITVTATITSDKDLSQVEIAFASDAPDLLIEDKQTWHKGTQSERIDIKANQPARVSRRFLVPKDDRFNIITSAMAPDFRVEDSVYIITTKDSGRVYRAGEPIPTVPFRYAATLPPGECLKGPLTPPSELGTPAPASGKPITTTIPTAPPPTRVLIPPTPANRAYP